MVGKNHNLYKSNNTIANSIFIMGEPYSDHLIRGYKYNSNINNVEILAIGASRVLQFKREFFAQSFFNLGYLAETPNQIRELIQDKNIKNKMIIISLDQFEFNLNRKDKSVKHFEKPRKITFLNTFLNNYRIKEILKFNIYPKFDLINSKILKIGAGAHLAMEGIISDGSYYYGKHYQGILSNNKSLLKDDYEFQNTVDRIKNGNERFEYGLICDDSILKDVEKLILTNKSKRNKVIYFFPPFAPKIQKLLKKYKYNYIVDATNKIRNLMCKYNELFFDFTFYNSNDNQYIDGFHGGSKLYYQLIKEMGIEHKDITFINNFELISDSILMKERKCLFK